MKEIKIKNKKCIIIGSIFLLIAVVTITFIIFKDSDDKLKKNITKTENQEKTILHEENNIIDQNNKFLQIDKNDKVLGSKDAPVQIIEYASLSCPHCAEFYVSGFDKLKEYINDDKVFFIYRNFPLNGPALAGAVISECYFSKVNDAKKYHNFIKYLFKTQGKWAFVPNFIGKLKETVQMQGISEDEFKKCLENKELQKSIISKTKEASELLHIRSTPTFIINNEIVSGYSDWESIEKVIEKKLN